MSQPTVSARLSVVVLAACFALSACQRETAEPPAPVSPPATTPAPPPPPQPQPSPVLDRAELLRAMDLAAAAYAAGQQTTEDGLAGRRFLVRQAFGCAGPTEGASPDGVAQWSRSAKDGVIELSLMAGDWTNLPLVAGSAADWEAVEGFWLSEPWLRTEACPGPVPGVDLQADAPRAATPQTMGLAAVFEHGGSRLGRRNGRAYRFVVRNPDGQPPSASMAGYRLVLEGRVATFTDGHAVHCRAASPAQRPVCLVASRVDRVAFESADGDVLSEWRQG